VHNSRSGRPLALLEVSGGLSRDGHAKSGHAVEHLTADPGLDLLSGQSLESEEEPPDVIIVYTREAVLSRVDGERARLSLSGPPSWWRADGHGAWRIDFKSG
jgi:hypothetical protein